MQVQVRGGGLHMTMVGATAATENRQPRQFLAEGRILQPKLIGIAGIECGGCIELGVTAARGIGAQPPQPVPGGMPVSQLCGEVRGVRTADKH